MSCAAEHSFASGAASWGWGQMAPWHDIESDSSIYANADGIIKVTVTVQVRLRPCRYGVLCCLR